MATPDEKRAELWEKIKDVRVAMITTVGDDGKLVSRPMYTQQEDRADGLWFFTAKSSGKADEIVRNDQVNVAYADPAKNLYVSIAGRGRIVDDAQKERELWNPMNKAFFPDGPEDPELVLLHVDPASAEYWDGPSGAVRQLFGMARAAVTGDREQLGENEQVDLD